MKRATLLTCLTLIGLLPVLPAAQGPSAQLKILLPLGRVAYQTNEQIDLSVVRSSPDGLKKGTLDLTLNAADGSKLNFTFPVKAAAGKPAVATENLHLNGYLLRPGKYTVRVTADGAAAQTEFEVQSHIRQSSFKLIDWGSRAAKHEQAVIGEDSMGFNLMMYAYGGIDADEMIRGRLDYMRNCCMGGWHLMDLRRECDWSDPYVLGGGIARASRQAFIDRINPNCLGVHFYDEPMLAGVPLVADPKAPKKVFYRVPAQERSFKSVFGKDAPQLEKLDFKKPVDRKRWMEYKRWRLLLLEAAWRRACYSVKAVRPDYLPASQNQWAWHAFDEGYYFNVNRPFPVISRHAWYDYKHGGHFAPSFSYEFGRTRDLNKPNWFLAMWYPSRSNLFRAEQYLSFMNNVQGLAKPPDLLAHRPSKLPLAPGLVESNKTLARLGTIFENMPVARPTVAVLYSMSHNLHEQTQGRPVSYHGNTHFQKILSLYMASKVMHTPIFPAVEEDVLDGSLLGHHKIVLLAGIDYMNPKVIAGLENYIAGGGTVLLSEDSKVQIKGSTRWAMPQDFVRLVGQLEKWGAEKQGFRWTESVLTGSYFKTALPVARALRPKLESLGIRPVCDCDQPGVFVSRQGQGDIDYFFAVNASPDFDSAGWFLLRSADARIDFPTKDRPVYDAVHGGPIPQPDKKGEAQSFRFGPGQMRVFASTSRPIGGVQVLTPLQSSDYTEARDPIRVEINAALVDDRKQILCGAAPLRIEVIDPLKVKRYDLYRATNRGTLRLTLPLAANDPAGEWTVIVRDLLANHKGKAVFRYKPAAQCAALAGRTKRSVLFGRDRRNIFRFFQTHKDLTIVKGTGSFNSAAAERLAESLDPWDVRCKIIAAADVKRRTLTAKEKPTWVDAAGAFDLRGPAILLGNPDDNPLIRHLQDQQFLPYRPVRDQFPGRGRSLLAWQRDGLGYFGQESLTLIAYDEAGMSEAVGTTYAIAAGMKPISPLELPARASITAANKGPKKPPETTVAWRTSLPDRLVVLRALPTGVLAISADGTLRLLNGKGETIWQKTLQGGESWSLDASPDGRLIVVGAGQRLYAFAPSGKQLFSHTFEPPSKEGWRGEGISFVALSPRSSSILVGHGWQVLTREALTYSHSLTLLNTRGEKLWSIGGVDPKTGKALFPVKSRFAAFCPDGKKIVLLTEYPTGKPNEILKKVEIFDAANGSLDNSRVIPWLTSARLGENLLLSDCESKLTLFSTAQEKVLSELDCDKAGPVTFAAAKGGIVIGTEADGMVRLVKEVHGKLAAQTVWQNKVYTKIVKEVAVHGGQIAVTYWGGTLRIFDTGGKLLAEKIFPQDISALVWNKDQWIAGLANGMVVAVRAVRQHH
jgi:hypothetical protein